jgi:uncharacterized MAPEG superfamily protein
MAHLSGSPGQIINLLAISFVIARVGYVICYLADWASLRSVVWTLGFLATFLLFISPLLG